MEYKIYYMTIINRYIINGLNISLRDRCILLDPYPTMKCDLPIQPINIWILNRLKYNYIDNLHRIYIYRSPLI